MPSFYQCENTYKMVAIHGGQVFAAAKKLACLPEEIYDFSSSMNHYAPTLENFPLEESLNSIRFYPADYGCLSKKIAEIYTVPNDIIFPTSGAIQALQLSCSLFRGKRLLWLEPGFSEYSRLAYAESMIAVPIHASVEMTMEEKFQFLLNEVKDGDVILLCQPQNPTGQLLVSDNLLSAWDRFKGSDIHWIIDESFVEMTLCDYRGILPKLTEYKNVISCRSFTKNWNIPGLRLGFLATANERLGKEIQKIQMPWSISSPAMVWAMKNLSSATRERNQKSVHRLLEEAQSLANQLKHNFNWKVYPSDSSFFLCELPDTHDAIVLKEQLFLQRILIRGYAENSYLNPQKHVRISARVEMDNNRLVEAIRNILK